MYICICVHRHSCYVCMYIYKAAMYIAAMYLTSQLLYMVGIQTAAKPLCIYVYIYIGIAIMYICIYIHRYNCYVCMYIYITAMYTAAMHAAERQSRHVYTCITI